MTSATFPAALGGDDSTVTDDADPNTGLANGGHRVRFVPALAQVVVMAQTASNKAAAAFADAQQTAADRVATGQDRTAVAADRSAVEDHLAEAETRIGTTQALVDARDAAQTAQTGAETAETGALQAQTDAEAARDAASVAGEVYADTTAGLAATTDGQYFKTPAASAEGFLTLYRNDAGAATEIETFPSLNGLSAAVLKANQEATRLARSLRRLGDDDQTLHADFAYDAYGLGNRMSGGVDTALADVEMFTVQRSTPKWVFQPSGPNGEIRLTEVAPDTLAREFGPLTGEPNGVLIEEARTNLVLWSSAFENAAWNKSGTTLLIVGAAADPTGGTAATKLVKAADETSVAYALHSVGPKSNSTIFTMSVFASPGELSSVKPSVRTKAGNYIGSVFDMVNETFSDDDDPLLIDRGFEALPGGWYRVWVKVDIGSDAKNSDTIGVVYVGSSFSVAFLGDGTSGIYIWGAQLEEALTPSSYIPTTDSPVTRAADKVERVVGLEITPSEGTIFIDIRKILPSSFTDYAFFFRLDDGGNDNRIYGIRRRAGGYSTYVVSGGVQQDEFINLDFGDAVKIGISWKDGGATYTYADGVKRSSGTNITAPSGLVNLSIGGPGIAGGYGPAHQTTGAFFIFPYAMSEMELQELTT